MLDTLGLRTFPIPLTLPPLTIGMAWHPRNHHDRTHQLLRERTRHIMATAAERRQSVTASCTAGLLRWRRWRTTSMTPVTTNASPIPTAIASSVFSWNTTPPR